jgi:uncharacterized protein
MKLSLAVAAGSICFLCAPPARTQNVQVSRSNRAIEVTAMGTARADAEIAIITVGFTNYAPSRDEAYEENARVANQVIQALLDGGLSKEAIHTQEFQIESRPYMNPKGGPPEHQYYAAQTWTIRTNASSAQTVVDRAVNAGANTVGSAVWDVADPNALEQKAGRAALAKARAEAADLIAGFGGKLGDLMYVSNTAPNGGALAVAQVAEPSCRTDSPRRRSVQP